VLAHRPYDYAIVRVVPRVERGEFINVGVIVSCAAAGLLKARIELDPERLLALDPTADVDAIASNLATIPLVCEGGLAAGPLGRLGLRERFHWLVAPRSTSVQTSAVHTGRHADAAPTIDELIERLMVRMVRPLKDSDVVGIGKAVAIRDRPL
jgi:hypothetical protein